MVFYTSVFFRPISGTASDEPTRLLLIGEQASLGPVDSVAPIWKFELGTKCKTILYLKRGVMLSSAKLSKV